MKFHTVVVIYNPNSTGDSEKNAKDFANEIGSLSADMNVEIVATKYAGHAEEIARSFANDEGVVVVSSSGDGGYNEVINGVLLSGGKCSVAVLPSGNANDHHRAVGSENLADNIVKAKTRRIETIKIETRVDAKPWKRFAHSYIGFGLTPKIGKVLTESRPNVVTEKWYVLRHAFSFRHVRIETDGRETKYHSLVVATIDRMSKVIKLDESANLNDGMMEVYESKYFSPFKTFKELVTVGLVGIAPSSRRHTLELSSTTKPLLVQLDGEVFTIDKKTKVSLVCEQDSLSTIA